MVRLLPLRLTFFAKFDIIEQTASTHAALTVGYAPLAAAVSNAGGLGMVGLSPCLGLTGCPEGVLTQSIY